MKELETGGGDDRGFVGVIGVCVVGKTCEVGGCGAVGEVRLWGAIEGCAGGG